MAPTAAAKRDIWTASEERELLDLRDSHPNLTWPKIARLFNDKRVEGRHRSSDAVNRKWHKLHNPARPPGKQELKSGPKGNFQQLPTMGNGDVFNGHGDLTLQRALELARENESGADPAVYSFLQRELQSVWSKLLARPNDYILTRYEFGLFNYFRQQYTGNEIATKALQRFWNHYRMEAVNRD
ncbi:hypothetical protein B0J12DRAFT_743875 [Macrophomina phaseolina]|uniref:Myb-like domain-containing protein n=1 Tax=Macrophomina phaseolina TaxID=35725 RepID=A0ABQ8G301_9PEZI|nr:hypothetical protein B0J12DRAFT_743875 [Macrophomina phaseolina]